MSDLHRLAAQRHHLRGNASTSRPLSQGYEYLGVAGEAWLRELVGAPPPGEWQEMTPHMGDNGTDIALHLDTPRGPQWFRVDVKTARKPINLIVEQGKVHADLYVLCGFNEASRSAYFVGWEWASVIRRMPVKDFGYGVRNHYRHNSLLRRLDEITSRLMPGRNWRVED